MYLQKGEVHVTKPILLYDPKQTTLSPLAIQHQAAKSTPASTETALRKLKLHHIGTRNLQLHRKIPPKQTNNQSNKEFRVSSMLVHLTSGTEIQQYTELRKFGNSVFRPSIGHRQLNGISSRHTSVRPYL